MVHTTLKKTVFIHIALPAQQMTLENIGQLGNAITDPDGHTHVRASTHQGTRGQTVTAGVAGGVWKR